MAMPLEGIRVLDFGWVMVGPSSGRYLADMGAEVLKIESRDPADPSRLFGPYKDGVAGLERSVWFHQKNAGKRSVSIDLKSDAGRELVLRLAKGADVVIESFSAGVIDRFGLGYEALRAVSPSLIMVSTSLQGRSGDNANAMTGIGTVGAALAGATLLVGWPDRPPAGPFGPWTDAVAPRFILASVLAALHRRRQTGEGCYIDLAQTEAALQFLMPAYYEYAFNYASSDALNDASNDASNDEVPGRRGDRTSPLEAPVGIYPCKGEGRWIAIDASRDAVWAALRRVIGGPLEARAFDTLIGRLRRRDELDLAIADWTSRQDAAAAEARLQEQGIAAHVVSDPEDLAADSDLRASGQLRTVGHPLFGEFDILGAQFQLSRTPLRAPGRGPMLGEHSVEVVGEIAGEAER